VADPASNPPNAPVTLTGDITKDRLEGLHAFQRISQAFAKGFDESEPQAYGRLLTDLMDYGALLVSGGLMSAKELLDKIEDLQQHIKKGGTSGKTVVDVLHEWMNGAGPLEASEGEA
jgi:hypothetical protein